MTNHTRTLMTVAAAIAALSLGACNRADDRSAGERVDAAANKTAQGATTAKQEIKEAAASVKSSISDAAITASVNAELARDNELSSLRIDVDTDGGKVALKGTAPNASARERATKLARTVDGVTSVDNQLAIKG